MKLEIGWRKKITSAILVGALLLPCIASADMSERELRLKALEKKYESLSDKVSFLDRFSFKGDFRLRHHSDFYDENNATTTDASNRHRQRLRLRLGGKIHINKQVDIGFRLVTGGTDPLSSNQTFQDFFSTKGLQLDRAFASFKNGPYQLIGGKFAVPFMKTEVIWDGDLSVEGAAEKYTRKMGQTQVDLILGQFVLEEHNPESNAPNLFAYQAVVSQKFGGGVKAKLALGYFDFNALRGNTNADFGLNASGNTVVNNAYAFNFDLLDFIGEVSFDPGIPVKVFGEWVTNTADDVQKDTAWQLGFKVGKKVKKFGDWQFKYLYKVVESDAVLGAISDSDFHGGGTNSKGSEINLKLGLMKGVNASVSYFSTEQETGSQDEHDIFQVDLIFKF